MRFPLQASLNDNMSLTMSTPATHPHGNSSSSGSNPLSPQPTEAIASSMSANFEELIKLGGYPGTQFARRFVTIGMANLLNLQNT
jgi:hypothetical protein